MRAARPMAIGLLVATGAAILIDVALAAVSQTQPPPSPPTPTAVEIGQVLAAYAGGDDLAVERWLSTRQGWSLEARRDFESVVRRNDVPRRQRLAFVLETIVAGRDPFFPSAFLEIGRNLIGDDAKALGVDATEDRFEVLWHQTAIATAQAAEAFSIQQRHLSLIASRFDAARRRGVEASARFVLARGVAAVGLCCYESLPGPSARRPLNFRPPTGEESPTVDGAVLFFRQAATVPALEVEALIRAGVALYGVGRHGAALGYLDRVPAHDDMPLGYVQHLTRGHAFDEMNRPAEAAAAYRRAREYLPTSQVAVIGLAAALLRVGDVESAVTAADAAKLLPAISIGADPRMTFRRADARYLSTWLAEIRRLRR